MHRPFKNKIISVVIGLQIPTAASASFPTKCPTIMLSTALYVSWNRFPKTSGMVNFTRIGMIFPVVRSFVIILYLLAVSRFLREI